MRESVKSNFVQHFVTISYKQFAYFDYTLHFIRNVMVKPIKELSYYTSFLKIFKFVKKIIWKMSNQNISIIFLFQQGNRKYV